MRNDILLENFITLMKKRVPERGKLANVLVDILFLEKEAVYRRLRGEVPFTFAEVTQIAVKMGISLDSVAEGASPLSRPFNMRLIEFLNPNESDYQMLEGFNEGIKKLRDDPDSESGAIANIIPISLCVNYPYIYKFYLYKWQCQFDETNKFKSFADTIPPERLNNLNREFVSYVQNSPSSVYIFAERFLEYFVNDVLYFHRTKHLTREEVDLIKNDLSGFLKDLRRYADNGKFDTGKKVSILVSNIHFDTNYNYVDAKGYKLTMIRSFTLSEAYSFDEMIFRNMKKWTLFLKHTSVQISESGEIQRIEFFEKQKALLDAL